MGFKPRYDLLLTMLAGDPAFLPSRHGRLQGGNLPPSKALMIWLVMAWRMSFWFGMADSWVIVGWQRLTRWCQLFGRRSHPKSKCSVYNLRQETPEISQKSPSNEYHTEHFT